MERRSPTGIAAAGRETPPIRRAHGPAVSGARQLGRPRLCAPLYGGKRREFRPLRGRCRRERRRNLFRHRHDRSGLERRNEARRISASLFPSRQGSTPRLGRSEEEPGCGRRHRCREGCPILRILGNSEEEIVSSAEMAAIRALDRKITDGLNLVHGQFAAMRTERQEDREEFREFRGSTAKTSRNSRRKSRGWTLARSSGRGSWRPGSTSG